MNSDIISMFYILNTVYFSFVSAYFDAMCLILVV